MSARKSHSVAARLLSASADGRSRSGVGEVLSQRAGFDRPLFHNILA